MNGLKPHVRTGNGMVLSTRLGLALVKPLFSVSKLATTLPYVT